jgi:tRNA A-37 threonylcarbamoyl transferase component Bud32
MKIVNYGQATHQGLTSEEELLKEVTFQHRASQQGLAPPIYQVLMKEQRGMIIMKIAGEATVLEVIEEILEDDKIPVDEKRNRINRYLMGAIDIVRRLHENGILHGDPHLNNIMLDRNGRMSIIDFGLSRDRKHGENPNTDFRQLIMQLNHISENYHGDQTILDMFRNISRNLLGDIPVQETVIDIETLKENFIELKLILNELMDDETWCDKTYKDFIEMGPVVQNSGRDKLIIAYNNLNTKIEEYRKDHNYNFRAKRSMKKSAKRSVKKSAKRSVKKSATKTKKSAKRSVKKSAKRSVKKSI